ncbi:CBO0543 family protein [Bacillus sp. FJAT-47783]|uniref:CBO0543 family protein n=1 Tax=Bacillus sp. FJAT-47783 TaxID=2922712 RepID=UPI001FACAE00|nr:CBO0543 family protein [Bacillus sp. FJAT-47783]
MMNIVKRLKKLNLPSSPKKPFFSERNNVALIATVLFASLLGTYLDLIFVHNGFYTFPKRLFPQTFSINILFTLVILPLITALFLMLMGKSCYFVRAILLYLIGVLAYFIEQIAENIGVFEHAPKWNHLYSLFGYIFFFYMMWKFYRLLVNVDKHQY